MKRVWLPRNILDKIIQLGAKTASAALGCLFERFVYALRREREGIACAIPKPRGLVLERLSPQLGGRSHKFLCAVVATDNTIVHAQSIITQ